MVAIFTRLRQERQASRDHRDSDRRRRDEQDRQREAFQANHESYAQLATPERMAHVRAACGDPSAPTIRVTAGAAIDTDDPTTSRFGGMPYLPQGMGLPEHPLVDDGQEVVLTFLAQINLADVHAEVAPWPDGLAPLPPHGLLQVWQLRTANGDEAIVRGGDRWTHVRWFDTVDPDTHRAVVAPAAVPPEGVALSFAAASSYRETVFAPPGVIDDDWIAFRHLGPSHPPHQLLGSPSPQGVDPVGPTEHALLQLAVDPSLTDAWMPSLGVIVVTIDTESLHRGDLAAATAVLTFS